MPCGWEGNRRSGVALAMRHRLHQLRAYGLDRQMSTPHALSCSRPIYLYLLLDGDVADDLKMVLSEPGLFDSLLSVMERYESSAVADGGGDGDQSSLMNLTADLIVLLLTGGRDLCLHILLKNLCLPFFDTVRWASGRAADL